MTLLLGIIQNDTEMSNKIHTISVIYWLILDSNN